MHVCIDQIDSLSGNQDVKRGQVPMGTRGYPNLPWVIRGLPIFPLNTWVIRGYPNIKTATP